MSLFDFDYSAVSNIVDPLSPVCGSNNTKSYELLGYPHLNASGPVFGADVIPADYDFSMVASNQDGFCGAAWGQLYLGAPRRAVGARVPAANLLGLLLLDGCAVSTRSGGPGHVIAKSHAPGRETRSPSAGA